MTGQSEYLELTPGQTAIIGDILPTELDPIPIRIRVTSPTNRLDLGDTAQLTVLATLPGGRTEDVTPRADGTTYLTSNAGLLTVDENGLVTGVNRSRYSQWGTIAVLNEGNLATVNFTVRPTNDPDNDGMPNDYEDLFGLNRNFNDADRDLDDDGLTNIEEFNRGTLPNNPDTDADGIPDGIDGDPLHPEEMPPQVTITSPSEDDSLVEDTTVTFSVDATDEGLLTGVELSTDTGFVATFDRPPFEAEVDVPFGIEAITFTATARDAADNVASASVSVDVVPDPLTTVVGTVIGDGSPAPGIVATAFDTFSAVSGADGSFSIPDVPTIRGDITVEVQGGVNGRTLGGRFPPAPPVAGGIVDVGELVLLRDPSLTSTGAEGSTGDEVDTRVLIDTNARVKGWSFGLCHNGEDLELVDFALAESASQVNDGGPPSFLILERASPPGNGVVMVAIVSIATPTLLEPTTGFDVLDLRYRMIGSSNEEMFLTRTCFCDSLINESGALKVPTSFTVNDGGGLDITVVPDLECGDFTIRQRDP